MAVQDEDMQGLQALDFRKYSFFKYVREDCCLIVTRTRVEIHEIRPNVHVKFPDREKPEINFYKRTLVWYDKIDRNTQFEVQAFDLQVQSVNHSRVLLVIDDVLHIYRFSFQGRRFRSGQLMVKCQLVHDPVEKIHDAKFFEDMDITYTKTWVNTNENQPLTADKINQYIYLKKTQRLKNTSRKTQACLDQQSKEKDLRIMTKNMGLEPMKIHFIADYMYMLLVSASRIELMCAGIYIDSVRLFKKSNSEFRSVLAQVNPNKKHKRRRLMEQMEDFEWRYKNKEAVKQDPAFQQIYLDRGEVQKYTDEQIKTFPIEERFSDSVMSELNMLKVDKGFLDKEAYSKLALSGSTKAFDELEQDPHLLIYQSHYSNKIVDAAATNADNSQRLLFLCESGKNPALIIVSCTQSGFRIEKSFDYCQLHQLKQRHNFGSSKTFKNLIAQSSEVRKTDPKKPLNKLVKKGRSRRAGNSQHLHDYVYHQHAAINDYKVMMYCPEDDSLIVIRVRVQTLVCHYFKNIDESKLNDLRHKLKKENLDQPVFEHNFEGDLVEVIPKISQRFLHEFPHNTRDLPQSGSKDLSWYQTSSVGQRIGCTYVDFSVKMQTIIRKNTDGTEREIPSVVVIPEVEMPDLITLADRGLWLDKNWFLKLVELETVETGKASVTKMNWQLRDKDYDIWEELDKEHHRIMRRQGLPVPRRNNQQNDVGRLDQRGPNRNDHLPARPQRANARNERVILEDIDEDSQEGLSSDQMSWRDQESESRDLQPDSRRSDSRGEMLDQNIRPDESGNSSMSMASSLNRGFDNSAADDDPEKTFVRPKIEPKPESPTPAAPTSAKKAPTNDYKEWKKQKGERKQTKKPKELKLGQLPEISRLSDNTDQDSSQMSEMDDDPAVMLLQQTAVHKAEVSFGVQDENSDSFRVLDGLAPGGFVFHTAQRELGRGDMSSNLQDSNASMFLVDDLESPDYDPKKSIPNEAVLLDLDENSEMKSKTADSDGAKTNHSSSRSKVLESISKEDTQKQATFSQPKEDEVKILELQRDENLQALADLSFAGSLSRGPAEDSFSIKDERSFRSRGRNEYPSDSYDEGDMRDNYRYSDRRRGPEYDSKNYYNSSKYSRDDKYRHRYPEENYQYYDDHYSGRYKDRYEDDNYYNDRNHQNPRYDRRDHGYVLNDSICTVKS